MEENDDLASWTLGLSLIVLTIAIHDRVVMMAFGTERIRVRVDKHKHDPRRAIPAVMAHRSGR
jgi:hypothetical protein